MYLSQTKNIKAILLICSILVSGCVAYSVNKAIQRNNYNVNTMPIAAWAFTDSQIVSGTINIGVVAYHVMGIKQVDFLVDGKTFVIREETINPDTNEYEFVLQLDTTSLTDLMQFDVVATVKPNTNTSEYTLPPLVIQVNQSPTVKNIYVNNLTGDDDIGDGTKKRPFATVGRALGFTFVYKNSAGIAVAGDIVKLANTGIIYDFPDEQYGTLTSYVNIQGGVGVQMYGGTLRSNFVKFTEIDFVYGGSHGGINSYNASHIWLDSCTYTGIGQIYAELSNADVALLSKDSSSHVTIENCTISNAAQGIMLVGGGRYIARNNVVHSQRADAYKIMLSDRRSDLTKTEVSSLFTNNKAYNIARPNGWSVANKANEYNFGKGSTFELYRSIDKGRKYTLDTNITLSGIMTSQQVVDTLNNDKKGFGRYMVASVSQAPYPNIGAVKIEFGVNNENYWFYVSGSAANIMNFIDNTRAARKLSSTNPVKTSDEHNDYLANDDGNLSQFILRCSNFYNIENGQGIKFDVITPYKQNSSKQGYKKNIALINNIISSASNTAARMFYLQHHGSGKIKSEIYYDNLLVLHNTFSKPKKSGVRSVFTIEPNISKEYITNMFIMNNIIGSYHEGDFLNLGYHGIKSNNNLLGTTNPKGHALAKGSMQGEALFTDAINGDYSITSNSPAVNLGVNVGVKYDCKHTPRYKEPDAGAYELVNKQ